VSDFAALQRGKCGARSRHKQSLSIAWAGAGKQRLWQYAGRRLADYDVISEWAGTVN